MKKGVTLVLLALGGGFAASGCHLDMWVQGKVKPQAKSKLYQDNMASRIAPKGTVAFEKPKLDTEYYTGYTRQGALVKEFPVKVDEAFIKRGRERYMIFCAPCHGQLGDGKGMIAARGFAAERVIATYHTDRLREMPVGHFFSVITNGYGAMYPFGSRINPKDRWAIASYIKALQVSQGLPEAQLSEEEKALLSNPKASGAEEAKK
jgi:mono/diheme cytochrome c family protein